MRNKILSLILAFTVVFTLSSVFADSSLQWVAQTNNLYNLGDTVSTTAIVSGTSFSANLICNGIVQDVSFPTFNNLPLVNFSIPIQFRLNSDILANSGTCQVRAVLDGVNYYTPQFNVSSTVNVTVATEQREFKPGDLISFSGTAVKQNGQNIDGLASINISYQGKPVYQGTTSVSNGNFRFDLSLPQDSDAGQYLVNIIAFEQDSGVKTNAGYTSFNMLLDQVPTTLSIVPQEGMQNIVPGQTFIAKAVLFDQTGQKISSSVKFTISTGTGEVIDQQTAMSDQFIEVPISYNDPAGSWTAVATSSGLTAQSTFGILKNSAVMISVTGKTLTVINFGNVPYNDKITVMIGDKPFPIDVALGVGQTQSYKLSAPSGNYPLKVLGSGGSQLFGSQVALTGNAININQVSDAVIGFAQYPWVWVALVIVIVFVLFFIFRGSQRKKRFSKKVDINKNFRLRDGIIIAVSNGEVPSMRNRMVKSRNVADFSSSIQGERQNASIVCLNIKNFEEVRMGKGGVSETMNRLKYLADESEAVVYENGNYFFFIFAPIKTKTSNNDITAIEVAQKIRRILEDHNRLMKMKMEFGISVNVGHIIAKHGINGLKFTTLGNIISVAKKLSILSHKEVVLSKDLRGRVAIDVKTEKRDANGMEFYPLIEIRNRQKSDKFVKEFMNKLEKEERETNKQFFNL